MAVNLANTVSQQNVARKRARASPGQASPRSVQQHLADCRLDVQDEASGSINTPVAIEMQTMGQIGALLPDKATRKEEGSRIGKFPSQPDWEIGLGDGGNGGDGVDG
jgi:hypothetical protein